MALIEDLEISRQVERQFRDALGRVTACAGLNDGSIAVSGVSIHAFDPKRWCNADILFPANAEGIKGALWTQANDKFRANRVGAPAISNFKPRLGDLIMRLIGGGMLDWAITSTPAAGTESPELNYFLEVGLSGHDTIGYRTILSIFIRDNVLSKEYQANRIAVWQSELRKHFVEQKLDLPQTVINAIGAWLTLKTTGWPPPGMGLVNEDFDLKWGGGTSPNLQLTATQLYSSGRITFTVTENGMRKRMSDDLTKAFDLHFS